MFACLVNFARRASSRIALILSTPDMEGQIICSSGLFFLKLRHFSQDTSTAIFLLATLKLTICSIGDEIREMSSCFLQVINLLLEQKEMNYEEQLSKIRILVQEHFKSI